MSNVNPFDKLRIDAEQSRSIKCQMSKRSGYSIVELLVVVAVFSVIAIIATQAVVLTLRGTQKSESLIKVRENVNYSVSVMERRIRNAQEITDCTDARRLEFIDENGDTRSFSCPAGKSSYIASDSARLTNSEVAVNCDDFLPVFSCTFPVGGSPPSVTINITAQAADAQGAEGAQITTSTTVLLRNY